MDFPIKLPVTVDKEGQMTDADGKVVAHFCWLNDVAHVRRQMIKAKFLERTLNDLRQAEAELDANDPTDFTVIGPSPNDDNGHSQEIDATQAVINASIKTMNDFKRKGNPAFQKGKPNPYKKKND